MFIKHLGEYLVSKNYLTKDQFDDIIEEQTKSRVKLGLIAVSEKMLTTAQADRINMLQATMDKRFGDIAVEQGFLTNEQVSTLLSLQENSYLKFIQTVIDKGYLKLEDIDDVVNSFKKEKGYSYEDIEALKSGDIDRIINIFVKTDNEYYDSYFAIMIRNINRFISTDISFGSPYVCKEIKNDCIASQCLKGDHDVFVSIGADNKDLLVVADAYAKEEFEDVDEDAYDSVCEFINCVNGLFASKLSTSDIDIDMLPPVFFNNSIIKTNDSYYVQPVTICNKQINVIVGIDSAIFIEEA